MSITSLSNEVFGNVRQRFLHGQSRQLFTGMVPLRLTPSSVSFQKAAYLRTVGPSSIRFMRSIYTGHAANLCSNLGGIAN